LLGALLAGALVFAPAAHARDAIVTSFDGSSTRSVTAGGGVSEYGASGRISHR
jgi:hypothetical protein